MGDSLLASLREALGANKLLTGADLEGRYVHIWKMNESLDALAVVLPDSTTDVSDALRICHDYNQPVRIHGGLTGLTGATETGATELVISLEKMNKIEEVDVQSRTMTVEAGVILENVQDAAREKDLLFPLNFGAKGTAQIGGIIATNAGGLRVLKYGMTRNLVIGLEAVLADGTVISSMKKIIKDNSGYDLRQLFVGSEGTLGIVTRAVLKLHEAPKSRTSAFIGIDTYEKVVDFLKFMDSGLAGNLSGYELIWKSCFEAMSSPPALAKPPLPYTYEYYVLIESLGSDQERDQDRMETLLEEALNKNIILDAAIAYTESDLNWFWTMREDVHIFISKYKSLQSFDISLPIPLIGEVVEGIIVDLEECPDVLDAFSFGHVADGNIHIIVGKEHDGTKLTSAIDHIVYAPLKAIGGSVSAEHGIGLTKKPFLHISRSENEVDLMRLLKRTMDPKGILNRDRIF